MLLEYATILATRSPTHISTTMPSIAKMVFGNGPLGPSYVVRTRTLARSHTNHILSFAPLIRQYPGVQKYWARWSNLYKHAAGYRQKGYLLDDLVIEESKTVQKVSRDLWRCKWTAQENVLQVKQVDASRERDQCKSETRKRRSRRSSSRWRRV